MRRSALIAAALSLAGLASSAEAQSYTTRTIGFEGTCAGTRFPDGDFSFFGYAPLATNAYAACGIQSIITTASSGGSPQVHRPQFGTIEGMDDDTVLAGGTASWLATGPLEFVFSPPVNTVSIRVLDQARANSLTIRALDAQDNIVNQQTPAVDADEISSYSYTVPQNGAPVVRLQVEYLPLIADPWFVDRLRFNAYRCGDGELEAANGEACDDGNTIDCDGCRNNCTTGIVGCLAGTECIANGSTAPGSFGCATCDTSRPRPPGGDITPANAPATTACNDGLYCNVNEACNGAGACVGSARDCNDGLSCTADSCNEASDRCDRVPPDGGGCAIGGACFSAGQANPLNPCEVCTPATSKTTWTPRATGATCGNPSCSGGQITPAPTCSAGGTCVTGTTTACPGDSVCADPFTCAGACTRDDQCLLGSYCANGTCIPKGDPGDACTTDGQCLSGQCADGVCCNTACDGTCESCALPGTAGTCRPYTRGTDPELECGQDSFCSGGRTCIIDQRPDGETCSRDELCASGNCVDGVCCGSRCDGTCEACNIAEHEGVCWPHGMGSDPEGECGVDRICSGQRACTDDKRPDGEACSGNRGCESGFCADGVCCNTACDRTCESCRVAGKVGECTLHEAGTDPDGECGDAEVCSERGECVPENRPNGAECSRGAVCASGFCADGVCCDGACDGACVSCKLPELVGTCAAFPAGTDPENECKGEAVCDGIDRCVSFETRGNGFCTLSPAPASRSRTMEWLALAGLVGVLVRRRKR